MALVLLVAQPLLGLIGIMEISNNKNKYMKFLKLIWEWIVTSSENPQKASLTIKGILAGIVMYAGLASGVFHFSINTVDATNAVTAITAAFQATLTLVSYAIAAYSAWSTAYGALRKIAITATGKHPILKKTSFKK